MVTDEALRVGISLRPQYTDWPALRAAARRIDELGFDWLLTSDHLIASPDHEPDPDGPIFESWQLVAAWAALTRRVRIGVMVSGVSLRHPAVVAKAAVTLDHISGGRAICGLGAGWFRYEAEAYGIDWAPLRDRLDRLDEAVAVVHSLLTEPRTTFDGRHYRLGDAPAAPKPLAGRLPILIGGGGERRTLRIAARYADIWNGFGDPSQIARKVAVLRAHLAEIGRDASAVLPTVAVELDPSAPAARLACLFADYHRVGVRGVIVDLPAPYDLALLERISREVRPRLVG